MQEFIEIYQNYNKHSFKEWFNKNEQKLLEKEKNQMLDLIRFIRINDKMGKSTYNLYDEFCGNNIKSKICEYCANEFIPKSPGMYDIKKYCSMDCREKEYYRRAKAKKKYNKFINQNK